MSGSPRPLKVSLLALLRDGHWGRLRLGMSRQDLVRKLGVPTRWMATDTEHEARRRGLSIAGWALSPILAYGGMEFHFPDDPAGPCWMIFSDDLDTLRLPLRVRLQVSADNLSEGLSEGAVGRVLTAAGLPFRREVFPPAPEQIRLHLPSGARLGLTNDDRFFDVPGDGHRLFCVELIRSQ